jgi:hypothetical protein
MSANEFDDLATIGYDPEMEVLYDGYPRRVASINPREKLIALYTAAYPDPQGIEYVTWVRHESVTLI